MNILLWIIQILLALLFMFSGSMKFVMSVQQMNEQSPVALPGLARALVSAGKLPAKVGENEVNRTPKESETQRRGGNAFE